MPTASNTLIHRTTKGRGFTLTELLVAIAIMVLIASITLPIVGALSRSIHGQGGLNTIQAAVTAARAYARRSATITGQSDSGTYSGAAILFTPANELRLVENDLDMVDTSSTSLESIDLNGYRDIDNRDYLSLQRDMGVVGLVRHAGGLALIAPPFAIRFDETGRLIVTDFTSQDDRWVLYDKDGDGNVNLISPGRPNGYDPDNHDPRRADVPIDNSDRYQLPFELMEAVVGVVLFSRKDFDALDLTLKADAGSQFLNSNAQTWLIDQERGQIILFSRYSGSVIEIE